jgi:hypothetical protein
MDHNVSKESAASIFRPQNTLNKVAAASSETLVNLHNYQNTLPWTTVIMSQSKKPIKEYNFYLKRSPTEFVGFVILNYKEE